MSLIAHRCPTCGGSNLWPKPDHRCGKGAPTVFPTWDVAGQTVERVMEPGKELCPGVRTCNCAGCKELYEQLAAAG